MLLRLSVRPRPLHFSLLRTPMSQASSNIQNVIQCEERMPMSKASSNARLETPLFDGVDYDQVLLPNGILAMLVSDTSLQRSAAAMAVGVGASSDPLDYPGLAHFTEHMLFLGTEKYPVENHYKQFLSKHGGSSNASTSMEATVYKFDVNHAHFEEALDIFSQFFRNPLFSPQCVDREIQAVDAEDSKNRQLDARRALQVLKSLMRQPTANSANEAAQYAKYSTGNARTLRDHQVLEPKDSVVEHAASIHTAEAMKEFYAKHYPKAPMAVTLVGPQDLAQLKTLAFSMFHDIPRDTSLTTDSVKTSCDHSALESASQLLRPSPFKQTGIVVRLPPVKEMKELTLIWSVPPTRLRYRADPCRLLSHLLGHEGEGSAFAALQEKGWITGLSAGTRATFSDSLTLFQVSVSLTPCGVEHHNDVAATIYAHIHALSGMSQQQVQTYWEDMSLCDWLDFHYKQKGSSPRDYAAAISNKALITSDPSHVFSKGYIHDNDMPREEVSRFLSHLTPDLSVTLLRHKGLADWIQSSDFNNTESDNISESECWTPDAQQGVMANRLEKWYGVHFHVDVMTAEELQLMHTCDKDLAKAIHLPAPNKYIPYALKNEDIGRDRDTLPAESIHQLNVPDVLQTTNRGNLLFTADKIFGHPRSALFLLVGRGNVTEGADGSVTTTPYTVKQNQLNRLTTKFYSRQHAVDRYPADVAGLYHGVTWWKRGIQINCSGFTPHLGDLLLAILSDPPVAESLCQSRAEILFSNVKEKHIRALQSWYKNRPDSQCSDLLEFLLQEETFLVDEQICAAKDVTFDDLQRHLQTLPCMASVVGQNAEDSLEEENSSPLNKMYTHGHLSRGSACALFSQIIPVLKAAQRGDSYEPSRAGMLPQAEMSFMFPPFNQADENSALVCHFQMGAEPVTPRIDAVLLLLQRFISEPMFTTLRTKEQLGYIVAINKQSFGEGKNRVGGLTVRVLSKQYDPVHMKCKLDEFLESFQDQYMSDERVSPAEFSRRVQMMISLLTEPPQSYGQEAQAIWGNIRDDLPHDYRQQVVEVLETITLASLRESFCTYVRDKNTRRRVSIMLCAAAHKEAAVTSIKESRVSVCVQDDAFATLRAIKSMQALVGSPLHLFEERDCT